MMNYPEDVPKTLAGACVEVPRQTLTERLKQERHNYQHRVDELDAVITALESNPSIQSILDLLQKTRCL